jgi:hypothetical protein
MIVFRASIVEMSNCFVCVAHLPASSRRSLRDLPLVSNVIERILGTVPPEESLISHCAAPHSARFSAAADLRKVCKR